MTRDDSTHGESGHEGGSIAVETALTVPILVLFFLAVMVFGHALYVRYLLAKNVSEVARACSVAQASADTCQQLARVRLQGVQRWCASLDIDADLVELPGLEEVTGVQVSARCRYDAGVGQRLLGQGTGSLGDLAANALVPY